MNKTDQEIMRLAKQSQCPVSKEYEERIDRLVSALEESELSMEKKPAAHFTKAGYAVCILAAILVLSIPASAAIDYVSKISEKDRKMYAESDDTKQIKEEQKQAQNVGLGEYRISDGMAVEIAADFAEGMFAIDTDALDMEREITYSRDYGVEGSGSYQIVFTENDTTSYVVDIDAKTGTLYNMWVQKEGIDFHEKPAVIDEEFFIANGENAKALFVRIFGPVLSPDMKIVGMTCEYKTDEEGNVPHGNVLYYVEMPNGEAYRLYYNAARDVFWEIVYYPYYRTEKELEEQGVKEKERVVIPLE